MVVRFLLPTNINTIIIQERDQGGKLAEGSASQRSEQRGVSDDKFAVRAPSITLPKGGGAIRGIGEKFAANPVTGTGSMAVPIATSPGRSGFGPQLSLTYDSGAGNGPFGFGWSLSLPSIMRKTDKGLPKYLDADESDIFILSGAEDLVPFLIEKGDGKWDREKLAPRTVDGKIYLIQRYRPRIEGLFARIERWSNQADPEDIFWRSISKDNITTWYGKTTGSRIADPGDPTRIFSWLICESYDDKGNIIVYGYKGENSDGIDVSQAHERNRMDKTRAANRYIKKIRYGNHAPYFPELADTKPWPTPPGAFDQDGSKNWFFEVVFDYGEHDPDVPMPEEPDKHWPCRNDPFSSYRAGFEVRTYRLCQRVLMFHHFPNEQDVGANCLVRSTDFTYSYEEDPASAQNPIYSFMLSVSQSGYKRRQRGYLKKSLPPLEFEYSQPTIDETIREIDPESLENLPIGVDSTRYQWVDLDGEGLSGILTEQADGWFYKRNLSPIIGQQDAGKETVNVRLGPIEQVAQKPSVAAIGGGRQQLLDLAGDGQLDLVEFRGPTPGFYERTQDESWEAFTAFKSLPVLDWDNPNLKFVDLTGDGHADILISEEEAFCWHPSLAEAGFGPPERVRQALDEEKGPKLIFADGTQSIYLADMSGDGLTDPVRIRNNEVCYWPNLGYGYFGAKVTMDNAPWFDCPDLFDQRRIRLADTDGSGTTDVLYLGRDGVRIYFNQSGNSWSPARALTAFPPVHDLSSVQAFDLLGNGTACLVWSSPLPADARRQMRYIDLMGGQKPHLLIKTVNNLGAETHVHYAPSTKFYLSDKLAGKPWITRLPFPVHVVERVETHDRISRNRFVTRYAYHHGYFDGEEREFRGFGMVEQWDAEEFAALSVGNVLPDATNIDQASHVPPVLTKTWFHTGTYLGREHVSDFFAGLLNANDKGEYYREPGLTDAQARRLLLDDTVLPEGLTPEEEREACRALKVAMLRQEVYALDGTDEQPHPYTVTEQNFTIRTLQPRGNNRHGVFFTHARESISYHYERKPADPRIGHALTLEVDDFGNVLKSAAIGYGRRERIRVADDQGNVTELPNPGLNALEPRDRAKQTQVLITYTENRVTNAVEEPDDHRAPRACESRTYELTGLTLLPGRDRFTFGEVLDAGTRASVLDYEKAPTSGLIEKRVIEHVRTYYRRNNLSGSLPLGELHSHALPFESYKLAFTPGLVAEVYGGRVSNAMLANQGRYVHTEGDANWWIPSGQIFYSPDPAHTPAQELAYARQHFFLPHRYRDPFHTNVVSTESFVSYDAYDLLITETRDALGNRVTAGERDTAGNLTAPGNDYRVLQPHLLMDANRNRVVAAFDALGMVTGTAVMGKPPPAPAEGDSLSGFEADLTETVALNHLADPLTSPLAILGRASSRLVYDLFAYYRTKNLANPQPAVVYTLARETHDSDPIPAGGLRFQHSFSYSDGFGREIQRKVQAEPGPIPQRDVNGRIVIGADGLPVMTPNDVSPRWVGSGWTVFNNKGKPVRQYEPFFTDTHRFEFDVRIGVSPVLFYDPVERVVATLHPNHTWEKVVFNAWRQETWDVNDTVLVTDPRTDPHVGDFFQRLPASDYLPTWFAQRQGGAHGPQEQAAARKAAIHAGTPSVVHADSLGRTFLTIAHNKFKYSNTSAADPPIEEFHRTRINLDIEGNQREVIDAKVRVVMRYDYDMLGTRVHQASMEAGERWMLNDVAGNPLYAWDSRNHRFRSAYDALRRPTDSFLQEGAGTEILVGRTMYGESRPNPEASNLRGKAVELRDQAGIVTSDEYDFKGNPLRSKRQLARSYKTTLDWSGAVPLELETYIGRTRYDALNRPIQLSAPHSDQPGTKINIIQPRYNEANLLEQLDAWLNQNTEPANLLVSPTATLHAVTDIDYNAKGQRELIAYGNGTVTTYVYDPLTFRLVHLLTRRDALAFPSDCPQPPPAGWPGCQAQNLHYIYDPAGNITYIRDDAQQTIYFRNKRVEPSADYTYDAVYRLIEATGREHLGQIGGAPIPHSYNDAPRAGLLHPGDGNAMGTYLERFIYDAVGNFLEMQHHGTDPVHSGWIRSYSYSESSLLESGRQSNRLTGTTIGTTTETYSALGDGYDDHGNMLRMPQLQEMVWDFKDQLQMTRRQAVSADDTEGAKHQGERTFYVYNSAGQRVRKVTELATGQIKEERIYLGGFEIYRRHAGGSVGLVRESLHIMDDKQRVVLVETRNDVDDGTTKQLIRYQYGNHLGSASLELDEQARIISYEEYAPYGSSTYQAMRSQTETPKRYRYTGKERDEESGFYYHGARYYAAWLGRWTSTDPAGLIDGVCLYAYCTDNPIALCDPLGTNGTPHLPGLIGNDPKVGALWEQAVVETLGPRFKTKTYADTIKAYQAELSKRIATKGLGSNRQAGTGINYARRSYAAVRSRFSKLAAKAGISLKDTQIHHSFDQLAKNPMEALRTTNLSFTQGHAATPGSGHNFAHEVADAQKAGVKNPGQHVVDKFEAKGMKFDKLKENVPELSESLRPSSVKPFANEGKTIAAEAAKVGGKEALQTAEKIRLKEGVKIGLTKAAKLTPVAGIVVGVVLVAKDLKEGDYASAGWDAAEAIPVVNDVVAAGHVGIAAGTKANEVLGIDKVAAEHGMQAEKAAKSFGLSGDASMIVGAASAALSAITLAPTIAMHRKVMEWFQPGRRD